MSTGQTLVSIQPEKAVSPLGKAIARLLQEAGLEIDIDQFGAIDEMAGNIVQLEKNDRNLHEWFGSVQEKADNTETVADQATTDIKSLESRFDELTNDVSALIDSMPIADRPVPNRYTSSVIPEAIDASLQ